MNGYLAFYGRTSIELYADSLYAAKQAAIAQLNLSPKQAQQLSVHLAEKNGQPVTHTPDF